MFTWDRTSVLGCRTEGGEAFRSSPVCSSTSLQPRFALLFPPALRRRVLNWSAYVAKHALQPPPVKSVCLCCFSSSCVWVDINAAVAWTLCMHKQAGLGNQLKKELISSFWGFIAVMLLRSWHSVRSLSQLKFHGSLFYMLKSFAPHSDLVRLQLHCWLICVLNLQILTQVISSFFSYHYLAGYFPSLLVNLRLVLSLFMQGRKRHRHVSR